MEKPNHFQLTNKLKFKKEKNTLQSIYDIRGCNTIIKNNLEIEFEKPLKKLRKLFAVSMGINLIHLKMYRKIITTSY